MEGMDLNLFQKIFISYSETTGYSVNIILLFLLILIIGVIYTMKFGSGKETFFHSIGTMIILIILGGFFTVYILDVKGLNEKRKIVLEQQKKIKAKEKEMFVDFLYQGILKDPDRNSSIEKINFIAEYLLVNDTGAMNKIEKIYNEKNIRLNFLLMKVFKDGTQTIFKDENNYNKYKNIFLYNICNKNNCDKEKLKILTADDIKYLINNSKIIFNKPSEISFFINIGEECTAASIGYIISQNYGNELAKKFNCINLFNNKN